MVQALTGYFYVWAVRKTTSQHGDVFICALETLLLSTYLSLVTYLFYHFRYLVLLGTSGLLGGTFHGINFWYRPSVI